jgi:hypothetical protein
VKRLRLGLLIVGILLLSIAVGGILASDWPRAVKGWLGSIFQGATDPAPVEVIPAQKIPGRNLKW